MVKASNKSIAQQAGRIRMLFPDSLAVIRRNQLLWQAFLQPTALSEGYRISLKYRLGHRPVIRVVHPVLQKREDEEIPHLYSDGSLCLYYPKAREFTSAKWLTETVIPWTSEWLFHYEIWLVTGKWNGGGIDH